MTPRPWLQSLIVRPRADISVYVRKRVLCMYVSVHSPRFGTVGIGMGFQDILGEIPWTKCLPEGTLLRKGSMCMCARIHAYMATPEY
jgi:hypothetical protein